MASVIAMEHIQKSFAGRMVLDDVNCSVEECEIFGLLGPSGAGKTTIINILIGQLKANGGAASLFGIGCGNLTEEVHAKIGMVLDESGLYSRLNCYDNLAVFADIFRVPKTRIKEVLARVKLEDAIKKPVSKLSRGMSQRLVLARAILHSPKLLFLDEPTSGLDPSTMLEIHNLLLECRKNGTTIFLTTHNMDEAAKLCDNVALLNEGVIVEYGEPDALCRKHNTAKTVKLLLKSGQYIELPCDGTAAKPIADYLAGNMVESIHSSEPDLETVFIKLAGRGLE
ncbi:MAG: ABC transporter ATP-binding protein [Clostridiales bacterium]|nr:ABC transporter ATP-binding protein [Clostridiales bacterium]